jgi:hypothetical protein
MKNLETAKVTHIQFFDHSHEIQIGENEYENVEEYSANIIVNDEIVIQLSGKGGEAHRPSVPSSTECYWNNEDLQDELAESDDLDTSDLVNFLDRVGVVNSFNFLEENGDAV